jgi:hypothetical protein
MPMPAAADDSVVVRDHATDARIGLGRMQTALGKAQRVRHVRAIDGAE